MVEGLGMFNAGDLEGCLDRMAPDLVMHYAELPEPIYGKETWRQGAEMMRSAFPDLEASIDDVVAADDRVAVRVSFNGTHLGDLSLGEFQTFSATSRRSTT